MLHRLGCSVACVLAFTATAGANCLPLSAGSADLATLDAQTETDPAGTAKTAEALLAALPHPAPAWRTAQLQAVLADARGELGLIDPAVAAVAAGLGALAPVAASPQSDQLGFRLRLFRGMMLLPKGDVTAALAEVDGLLKGAAEGSLEQACALSVRAMIYDRQNKTDSAVADALVAFRIADENGWTNAKLEAAYSLARNFRRAGLYAHARRMLDVVQDISKARGLTVLQSSAEYELGQLFVSLRQFAQARAVLESSKDASLRVGDGCGAATADVALCGTLIEENDLDAADAACRGGDAALAAGQRPDLVAWLMGLRARLDLARHHPAAALDKLRLALSPRIHELLPAQEPGFYRDRGRALAELGRYREAYVDSEHAEELERSADTEQRNRQVAVLSAVIASEELSAANRSLEARLRRQQLDLTRQLAARRLWTIGAGAGALLSAMFAYLLVTLRRHDRSLRRRDVILRTAARRAPDAVLSLDENRVVRFANRNLCGIGASHAVGEPLDTGVPAQLMPALTAALDEAYRRREVVNFTAQVGLDTGMRQFEICVVPALDGPHMLGATLRSIDVTERRALERAVIDGASLERQRLSSDLHEGLGQQLAGVMLLVGNLANAIKRGRPGALQLVAEIADYVTQSIELTRELARGLAPVKVGCGSLGVALETLVEDARKRLRVAVVNDCRLDGLSLSDLAADHLYRICREAVTNAALHGQSSEVHVHISFDARLLSLIISDNGSGFASSELAEDGFGIKMMAYRARLLGGSLRFEAIPGGGARVTVSVPVAQIVDGAVAA